MKLPLLDYSYNEDTLLDPDGALVILDNLEKLISLVEFHIDGTYKHEARHITHKKSDLYSEIYRIRSLIGELRGKVSTVSSKATEIDERCKEIIKLSEKLTTISINGLTGDVRLKAYAGSDMMVGNALDRPEITIANTQPEEVKVQEQEG